MNIFFIIIAILFISYLLINISKKVFSIKESFFWVVASIIVLLLSIFPKSLDTIAAKLNIAYSPSMLFLICILALFYLNLRITKIMYNQNNKITDLTEQIAILKHKVDKK